MLSLQRKQLLLNYLAQHGSGTIAELSTLLGVSEMTVRRDLKALETEHLIQRTHGGAVYPSANNGELTFAAKESRHPELKEKIAQFAVQQFVHDNAVIILEGGTTVTCMAGYLGGYTNLTILTNGVRPVLALNNLHPTSTIMLAGGMLRTVNLTLTGSVTTEFFRQFNAQLGFFSAIGFTLDDGFTDANVLESHAKIDMKKAVAKTVVLLDSTKFGQRSLTKTFDIADVDVLITDPGAPATVLEELRRQGVEVLVVS